MSHVRLYDPDGEPFDVAESRVGDLVLNKGWTQTEPTLADGQPLPGVAFKGTFGDEGTAEPDPWRGSTSEAGTASAETPPADPDAEEAPAEPEDHDADEA